MVQQEIWNRFVLQLVVEQLVDGAGSYERRRLQCLQAKHAMWRKKLTDAGESVLERLRVDKLGDLGRGQSAVEAEEVRGETSNVRSSHGRSRDTLGLPIVPSRNDVQTRSPDINGGTKVGERGLDILDSRSGDGNRLLNTSGRVVACVLVVVPCGYDDSNAAIVKLETESLVSGVDPRSIHSAHTATTAASVALEAPPPKLIEATVGLPVLLASWATQLMPAILQSNVHQSPLVTKKEETYTSELLPEP